MTGLAFSVPVAVFACIPLAEFVPADEAPTPETTVDATPRKVKKFRARLPMPHRGRFTVEAK